MLRRAIRWICAGLLCSATALALACPEDEGTSLPPICEDCENDDTCRGRQPTINPLVSCPTVDAQCHYCGDSMVRWTCSDMNGDGNLVWTFSGNVDECPPPVVDTDS